MNIQKFDQNQVAEIVKLYSDGNTIQQISDAFNMSTGKTYYTLMAAGCEFRRKGMPYGFKQSEEFCKNLSARRTGKKMSDETKSKLSESKKCHYNGLNGYGHTKSHNRGYAVCYVPDHPNSHSDGYAMLHTVLMEIHIGRYLTDNEVVHHLDGNRNNNDINNLALMTRKEHQSMHMKIRRSEGGDLYQPHHSHR